MDDVQVAVNEASSVFSRALVAGNHDTITLFGIQPQNRLKDYSRKITTLMLKENEELDMTIAEVLAEIEHFETKANSPLKSFLGKHRRHQEIVSEYRKILSYVEDMTLYFKLQQAQLIKEIKLLEKLFVTVSSCSDELECCVRIGKEALTLRDKLSHGVTSSSISPTFTNDGSDMENWYARLEKRIDDLSVSHAASLQSQTQIRMLYDNDLLMLDKIAGAISNTFPIWQNQMAIMLGIELLDTRLSVQERIMDINDRHIEKTSMILKNKRTRNKAYSWDLKKMRELNEALSDALNEMAKLDENSEDLRKGFLTEAHL